MNYIASPPICPSCKTYLDDKDLIHHCLIFTNGIPDTGYNHMKMTHQITEVERTVLEDPFVPKELMHTFVYMKLPKNR